MMADLRRCDHCGAMAECTYGSDPFIEEVYEETTEETWWCNDCWSTRKEDV